MSHVMSVIPTMVPIPNTARYASAQSVTGIAASTRMATAAEPASPWTIPMRTGRQPEYAGCAWPCAPAACGASGRRLLNPSRMSMSATPNSKPSPRRGGIAIRNTTRAPPTTNTVSEWPMPQRPPIQAARAKLRSRVTIVVTATTWSASVACRRPRRKPRIPAESALSTGLGNRLRLPLEEVHQDELAERHRVGEVRPAARDARDHLHELHQGPVAREHEGVDHDAGPAAVSDLLQGLAEHIRVESHRVLVDLPVGHRQRAGLAVGDHDDLAHVLFLREQQALRELEPLGGVRVVRPHLGPRQRGERNLLGRVVEEDDLQRVAGELRPDEVRERERDLLRGGEAVFAVKDHRVGAVEHQHGGAARAVLRLADHQVGVVEVDGDVQVPVPDERVLEGLVHVEVQHVAELVRLAPAIGLDSRGEVGGVVRAEARLAERREDSAERLVAEEVDALIREVELHVPRGRLREAAGAGDLLVPGRQRGGRFEVEVPLRDEALDDLVEHRRELLLGHLVTVTAERLEHFGRELARLHERVEDGLLEGAERLVGIVTGLTPERVKVRAAGETRLEEEVGEVV